MLFIGCESIIQWGDNVNTSKKLKIGEAIRKQRKKQGLTLNELGEKIGISGSLVGQYERGVVNPKYETVVRFANALDVSPRELFGPAFSDMVNQEVENIYKNSSDVTSVKVYYSGLVVPMTAQEHLMEAFSKLNIAGQKVAIDRVEELTLIAKYKKTATENGQSAETAEPDSSQPTPADTSPAE